MENKSRVKIEKSIEQFEKKVSELKDTIKKIRKITTKYMALKSMRDKTKRKVNSIESKLWRGKGKKEELRKRLESEKHALTGIEEKLEKFEGKLDDFDDFEALSSYLSEKKIKLREKTIKIWIKLRHFKEEVKEW